MAGPKEVEERELIEVLTRLRDLRAWALKRHCDPWAFRQALLITLELDTATALEQGHTPEQLAEFDAVARKDAREWLSNRRGRAGRVG